MEKEPTKQDFPPDVRVRPVPSASETDRVLDQAERDKRMERIEGKLDDVLHRRTFDRLKEEHAGASESQKHSDARFVRDASHADDNWAQAGVRWVEETRLMRKYVIPAAKVGATGYVTYKGVRLAWKGIKYVKNLIVG